MNITILKPKNKILFRSAILFLAATGILLPLQFINAGSFNVMASVIFSILYVIGQAASYIAITFLGWAGGLFDRVLSPGFNTLSLTNSYFVKQGWTITRNFANMIFMLIMLVIAFSVILRVDVGGINIKRTLPKLIFVAFFINFSRVIAGVIIDAGQIVMVTFTNGVVPEGSLAMFLYNHMKAGSMFASPGYLETVSNGYTEGLTAIATMFFNAAFPFIAALAFFILAVILIIRIVVLWILVILAPLAWLAYILPNTETYWKQWWSLFLQHTFFGAAIGFFMYLSAQMAANLSAYEQFTKQVSNNINTSSGFLADTSNLLQYLAIIIMLYVSIIAAKKTNSMGVNITFKALNTAKQKAYQWGVKTPLVTSGIAGGVAAKVNEWRTTGWLKNLAPSKETVREREQSWAARFGVKGIQEAQENKDVREAKEKIENTAPEELKKILQAGKITRTEAKAIAEVLGEREDIKNKKEFDLALNVLLEKDPKTGEIKDTVRSNKFLKKVGEKRLDIVLNYKAERKAQKEKLTPQEAFQKVWEESNISLDKIAQQELAFVKDDSIRKQLIKNGITEQDINTAIRNLTPAMKGELLTIAQEARKNKYQGQSFEQGAGT